MLCIYIYSYTYISEWLCFKKNVKLLPSLSASQDISWSDEVILVSVINSSRRHDNQCIGKDRLELCFLLFQCCDFSPLPSVERTPCCSLWGDDETHLSKIQHDKFEKKIFFWRRLSQHWKEPEERRPLTFHLAGIKQEAALLLFMTSSVGSVSVTFLLHIHSIAPTVVEVTS